MLEPVMDSLDDYLLADHPLENQQLASIEKLIAEVSATLVATFDPRLAWPHRVGSDGPEDRRDQISEFATVLAAVTLWKLLGLWRRPAWRGAIPSFAPLSLQDTLRTRVQHTAGLATDLLIKAVTARRPAGTRSRTYGANDPFSLSYLFELAHAQHGFADTPGWAKLSGYASNRARTLYAKVVRKDALWKQEHLYGEENLPFRVIPNAMIAVRVVQTLLTSRRIVGREAILFRDYFETTLYQQIAYSSIPDSRFDPAELAFSLEGMLISQHHAVDRTLFERGMTVLKEAQVNSAFWRPVKPFLATDKGLSLFPVSVEVANSILRSCEIIHEVDPGGFDQSESVAMFRRYLQWTQARTVRFRKGTTSIVGWHSEHVNEPGAIHVWETSLVLEFLVLYRRYLRSHMAKHALKLARLPFREPSAAQVRWR